MSLAPAVVIGSSGQVARALMRSLKNRQIPVLHTSSSNSPGSYPLDLSRPETISALFQETDMRLGKRPLEIFLAGAFTHVDKCEEERDRCQQMNELSPALIAEECAKRGHKLTFFSTEYVFGEAQYRGGAIGPFTEEATPAPTSFYGLCKMRAEQAITEILGDQSSLHVRTTMVFSWDPKGSNFLMQYLKQLDEIRNGFKPPIFRVPEDQISTPAYAPALAESTCILREKGVGGIVNLVGSDLLSRRQLVEKVISAFGYDREKSLEGFRFLKTAELGQKAKRPLSAGLTMSKAISLGLKPCSLDQAFAEILLQRSKGA